MGDFAKLFRGNELSKADFAESGIGAIRHHSRNPDAVLVRASWPERMTEANISITPVLHS